MSLLLDAGPDAEGGNTSCVEAVRLVWDERGDVMGSDQRRGFGAEGKNIRIRTGGIGQIDLEDIMKRMTLATIMKLPSRNINAHPILALRLTCNFQIFVSGKSRMIRSVVI